MTFDDYLELAEESAQSFDLRLGRAVEVAVRCKLTGFVSWLLQTDSHNFGKSEPRLQAALDEAIERRRQQMMQLLLAHAET